MSIPTLETERLKLRPFQPGDLDDLAGMMGNESVMRYIGRGGIKTRIDAEKTIQRINQRWEDPGISWWAVERLADGRLLGWCGLNVLDETGKVEVLYMLDQPFWGNGYAVEAASASLRFGFEELGLEEIIAISYPQNKPSQRVMEKIGMQPAGTAVYFGINFILYEIKKQDFIPGSDGCRVIRY